MPALPAHPLRLVLFLALLGPIAAVGADTPEPATHPGPVRQEVSNRKSSKPRPPKVPDAPRVEAASTPPPPADEGFRRAPAPAWVREVEPDPQASAPKAPLLYELMEEQARIEAGDEQRFQHYIRLVNDSSALGTASQLEVEFDPGYQHLVLHRLTIVRGGQPIDKLGTARISLLHREAQLERQVYDGKLSASIVLDDLRVGDRVDFAYTITGRNPVFEGQFVDQSWVASARGPIRQYQYRLLAPEARTIRYQLPQGVTVQTSSHEGWRETLFRKSGIPVVPQEINIAPVYFQGLTLQLSEFDDWATVSGWAARVFAQPETIAPEVIAQAATLKAAGGTPLEQARRVLDFVQTEIRYFGTENGVGSHRPAAPETVLRQRFGDCKDKVVLLATLLRALGIEAQPTLVSAAYREDVAKMLPSPLDFDHVIVRVALAGEVYWLDATRTFQKGPLGERQALVFGRGIIIGGAAALSDLPRPTDLPLIETQETLRFSALSQDPILESRTSFHGDTAEAVRAMAANIERAEFEKNWTGDYARFYPRIALLEPITLEEQPDSNTLVVHARFSLPEYLHFNDKHLLAGDFVLLTLVQAIQLPGFSARTTPFARNAPGIYRHQLTVEYPEDTSNKDDLKRYDEANHYFSLHVEWSSSKRSAGVKAELHLLPGMVPASEWQGYVDSVRKQAVKLSGTAAISPIRQEDMALLGRQIVEVQDQMKGFWVKAAEKWQAPYKIKMYALSAQLQGGRLPPHLRADVLVDRGAQLDLLDRAGEAQPDFEEALKLAPTKASVLSAAAVNASLRGDDRQALALAGRALAEAPNESGPHATRAFTYYQTQQYAETVQELQPLLSEGNETPRLYAAILLSLATQASGGDGTAAAREHYPASTQPEWPNAVLRLLGGDLSLDNAIAAARKDGQDDAGRLCELYYYAAEKSRLSGDAGAARKLYQRSLDTGVTGFNEYAFARRALARLTAH